MAKKATILSQITQKELFETTYSVLCFFMRHEDKI